MRDWYSRDFGTFQKEFFFKRMFDRTVWKREFLKEIEKFHLDFKENDRFLERGMSFFEILGLLWDFVKKNV